MPHNGLLSVAQPPECVLLMKRAHDMWYIILIYFRCNIVYFAYKRLRCLINQVRSGGEEKSTKIMPYYAKSFYRFSMKNFSSDMFMDVVRMGRFPARPQYGKFEMLSERISRYYIEKVSKISFLFE